MDCPQSGTAFLLRKGEVLRVIDPMGEQVADLFAFKQEDLDCALSSGRSIDYAGNTKLSSGDTLYSNDSRPMFTILGDLVGHHDLLLTPCSQQMFEILYGCTDHHPSCFQNLTINLAAYGVRPAQINTTFNIFMEVNVDATGGVKVGIPRSKPGDWIELRAEMNLICGLTACSAEGSNNGSFKPIDYVIHDGFGKDVEDARVKRVTTAAAIDGLHADHACNGGTSAQQPCEKGQSNRASQIKHSSALAAWN